MLTALKGDERRMVAALMLQYLTMGVASTLVMSVAFAAFFAHFDADTLTLVYLANGAVISAITGLFLRLTRRLPLAPALLILSGSLALSIAAAVVLWQSFDEPAWLAFALPVLFQTLGVLNNLIVWTLAGRLFDVRQGRRFFGMINTSFWIGAIPTGLIVPVLVPIIGLSGLLLVACAISCIAFAELIVITHAFSSGLIHQTDAKGGTREPVGNVLRDPYVRLLFFATVCGWLAFYAIDNIFYDLASRHFPAAGDLAGFMGLFMAAMGVATIIVGWLGSLRVIDALGIPGALLLLPAILTVLAFCLGFTGLLPMMVASMFWLAAGSRLLNTCLRNAVTVPASNLAFQPLPVARRATAQTLAEGVVQPLAIGMAGLALLLLRGMLGLDAVSLAWALGLISLAWAAVSIRLGKAYRERLGAALRGRLLDSSERLPFQEEDLRLLESRLGDPRPAAVAYAVDMLQRHAPSRYFASLPTLLNHPDRGVRIDGLTRLEACQPPPIDIIRRTAEEDVDVPVRARAMRALALLSDRPELTVRSALDDDDGELRAAAIIGLLRRGEADGLIAAAAQLEGRLNAPDPAIRAWVARVLGESELRGSDHSLRQLLNDPEPHVARAALAAAARLRSPALWPDIVALLGHRRLRGSAANSLAAGGDAAAAALAQARATSRLDRAATIAACATLSKLPGPVAASELADLADSNDEMVRLHALVGQLRRSKWRSVTASGDLETLLGRETTMAADLLDLAARTRAADAPLLAGAFAEATERCRSRTMLLLALHRDTAQLRRAATILGIGLGHSGRAPARAELAHQRALAIELIDGMLPGRIRPAVLALLEDLPNDVRRQRLAHETSLPVGDATTLTIGSWQRWGTDWLSACALHLASRPLSGEVAAAATLAAAQAQGIVAEAAHRALVRNRPEGQEVTIMMSAVERVILLKGSNFFAGLPDSLLGEIGDMLEEMQVAPGTRIVEKGAADSALYLIAVGRVGVFDGERQLATLEEGKLFGEMALLDPGLRSATVTALDETRLLRLDGAVFQDVLEDNQEMARAIIGELVQRLRRLANAG